MSFELSLVFCLVCNRQKPCLFSRHSETMALQKKCTEVRYFLYYWGKWNFVFSKVYSFLDGKQKLKSPSPPPPPPPPSSPRTKESTLKYDVYI